MQQTEAAAPARQLCDLIPPPPGFRSVALRPTLSSGMPFRAFSTSHRVHRANIEIKSLNKKHSECSVHSVCPVKSKKTNQRDRLQTKRKRYAKGERNVLFFAHLK